MLAAVEAATADGVDVINYSIGGVPAEDTVSAIERAFLGAANAGIFVAASAPNPESASPASTNSAPWITSVGTSSYRTPQASLVLDDGTELTGASTTVTGEGVGSAPLVLAGNAALDDGTGARQCAPDSLDPDQVNGKIVVCDRGGDMKLTAKAAEVAESGGTAMVLLNTSDGDDGVQAIDYAVPTVHLGAKHRQAVRSYAQEEGASASMVSEATDRLELPAPQLPASAGIDQAPEENTDDDQSPEKDTGADQSNEQNATGQPQDGDPPKDAAADATTDSDQQPLAGAGAFVTPDVVAPGTHVLAAGANARDEDPVQTRMSGTSTATPHVAGLAAVYLGEHPNASPAEIKSALMTTASNTVDAGGDPRTDVLAQGAGHVDPGRYLDVGMYFPAGTNEWAGYLEGLGFDAGTNVAAADRSQLNLPSITIGQMDGTETVKRTVVSTEKGTYKPSVKMPGVDVSVSPSHLKFNKAGQQKTFEVTFKPTRPAGETGDEISTGYLTWTSKGGDTIRMPLAVAPQDLAAPDTVNGKGATGNLEMTVAPDGEGETAINTMGLVKGHVFKPAQGRFIDGFLGDPTGGGKVESFGHSGSALAGQTIGYETEIPRGTRQARFSLDAMNNGADLDLVVVKLDGDGIPAQVWQSASGSPDETVVIDDPASSAYLVQVKVQSPPPANTMAEFELTSFAIPSAADGSLAATPKSVTAKQGQLRQIKLSWEDLDHDSVYRSLVDYSGSTATTAVRVETGKP